MRWRRVGVVVAASTAALAVAIVARGHLRAERQAAGDEHEWVSMANGVAANTLAGTPPHFATGSTTFDGEWALVTCQMAIMGLEQVARRFPEHRAEYMVASAECARRMLTADLLDFGARKWGMTSEQVLAQAPGHAWLGYLALALGRHRRLDPSTPYLEIHDHIIQGLALALDAAPHGLIETYPGEAYPADVASVAGAIAEHGGYPDVIERWRPRFRSAALDPVTGLLRQHVSIGGHPVDGPRASGTGIACFFAQAADPSLSEQLWTTLRDEQLRSVPLFAAVREHPPGVNASGDIDSGPLILGTSVSATAFAIGCGRIAGDGGPVTKLISTSDLFGIPYRTGGRRHYAVGGSMGDAILLAMGTAMPWSEPAE